MRVKITKAAALCLVVMLGIGLYFAGCTKKPSQPPPVVSKEYYAYFGDQQSPNTYYRYSTTTFEVDSFYLPYDSYNDGFGISPDGKTMYLHPDDAIIEVSLDSFEVDAEHPIDLPKGFVTGPGHQIVISPDNRYMAILVQYLHILDLSDFSVIYSDTSTFFGGGWFADDSRTFFCAAQATDRYEMLEVSLNDGIEATRHLFEEGSFSQIVTSPDNRLWFLMLYAGYGISIFQAYDVELDSIVFSQTQCPGFGHMAITPDGRYVAFTRPGNMQGWCPTYRYIIIYDVIGKKIEREVYTYDDSSGVALAIGELWITPDGHHLVGISAPVNNEGHGFQYNLKNNEVENRFRMYPTRFRALMNLVGPRKY